MIVMRVILLHLEAKYTMNLHYGTWGEMIAAQFIKIRDKESDRSEGCVKNSGFNARPKRRSKQPIDEKAKP
jgi:hypothetical protein